MEYEEKVKKLEDLLRNKKVGLCFSGGSDSSLLAYVGSKVSSEVLLITFNNGLFPKDFIKKSKEQADKFNLKQVIIRDKFIKDEEFTKNDERRCLICREKMYSEIKKVAEELLFAKIPASHMPGSNLTPHSPSATSGFVFDQSSCVSEQDV